MSQTSIGLGNRPRACWVMNHFRENQYARAYWLMNHFRENQYARAYWLMNHFRDDQSARAYWLMTHFSDLGVLVDKLFERRSIGLGVIRQAVVD